MSLIEIVPGASYAPPLPHEIADDMRGPFRYPNVATLCGPGRIYRGNACIVQGRDYSARVVPNISHLGPVVAQPVTQVGEQLCSIEYLLIDL